MKNVTVIPADGLRVRTDDGRRHIREEGESVPQSTYYRRRIKAGDLIEVGEDGAPLPPQSLAEALKALEQGNPDHWTEGGKPDLNHLSDVLNRRVSRKEVDETLQEMEA